MALSVQGIQIPSPLHRPGDRPDFSHLEIPQAGGLPRTSTLMHVTYANTLSVWFAS